MSDHQIGLVNDEDVPLAVDALWAVVVGEGGVEALGLVPADGVVDEESGVFGGSGAWRDGGNDTSRNPLDLGSGDSRIGRRSSGSCGKLRAHYLLDIGTGQPGIPASTGDQERQGQNGQGQGREDIQLPVGHGRLTCSAAGVIWANAAHTLRDVAHNGNLCLLFSLPSTGPAR